MIWRRKAGPIGCKLVRDASRLAEPKPGHVWVSVGKKLYQAPLLELYPRPAA